MKQLYFQLANPFWNTEDPYDDNYSYVTNYTIYFGVPLQTDISLRDHYYAVGWKFREYRISFPKRYRITLNLLCEFLNEYVARHMDRNPFCHYSSSFHNLSKYSHKKKLQAQSLSVLIRKLENMFQIFLRELTEHFQKKFTYRCFQY